MNRLSEALHQIEANPVTPDDMCRAGNGIRHDAAGRHADPAHLGRMSEAYDAPEDRRAGISAAPLVVALAALTVALTVALWIGWPLVTGSGW